MEKPCQEKINKYEIYIDVSDWGQFSKLFGLQKLIRISTISERRRRMKITRKKVKLKEQSQQRGIGEKVQAVF